MKLIQRTQYIEKIISVMRTPDIKVIKGARRNGKSKFQRHLQPISKKATQAQISYTLIIICHFTLQLQRARELFNAYKLKEKIVFGLVLSFFAVLLVTGTVLQIVLMCLEQISKLVIISTIITGVDSMLTIIFEIVSYKNDFDKWFVKKLLKKRKHLICEQNNVPIEKL